MQSRMLLILTCATAVIFTGSFVQAGEKNTSFFPFGGAPEKGDYVSFSILMHAKDKRYNLNGEWHFFVESVDSDGNYKIEMKIFIYGPAEVKVISCKNYHDLVIKILQAHQYQLDLSNLEVKTNKTSGEYNYILSFLKKSDDGKSRPAITVKLKNDSGKTTWSMEKFMILIHESGGEQEPIPIIEATYKASQKNYQRPPPQLNEKNTKSKLEEFFQLWANSFAGEVKTWGIHESFIPRIKTGMDILPSMEKKKGDLNAILMKYVVSEKLMYQVYASYIIISLKRDGNISKIITKIDELGNEGKYDERYMGILLGYFGDSKYFREYESILAGGSSKAKQVILVALEFVNFNFARPKKPPTKEEDLSAKAKYWLKWLETNRNKTNVNLLNEKVNKLIDNLSDAEKIKRKKAISDKLLLLTGAEDIKDDLKKEPDNLAKIWKEWRKKTPRLTAMPKKETLFDKNLLYKWLPDWEKKK